MALKNETFFTPLQVHFIRSLIDGRREISDQEAATRAQKLGIHELVFPCVVVSVAPYYTSVPPGKKDEVIQECSNYICRFLEKAGYIYLCNTNSYDNILIIIPTQANQLTAQDIENTCIRLHQKFCHHFQLEAFIGIGSEVSKYTDITKSASEANEMLAYKYQFADRGVINCANIARFKHLSLNGGDIMFERVIGRFQDGDLGMMAVRLDELVESIRKRLGISNTAIRRTFIELAVNILHIAANADVDVDAVLGGLEVYNWVMQQNHTEVLTEWLLSLSAKLLSQMERKQDTREKEIIRQACEYISLHIDDPCLSLQTISESVKLSASYFSQLFKEEKGTGVNNYITESRVELSKQLLLSTNCTCEMIALQTGFTTATYFGRVFKKKTGLTPNEYRRSLKSS